MEQPFLRGHLGSWLEEGGERLLQSSSPFPSTPIRHKVFPSYGAIVSASNVASSLARTDHVSLSNPGSDIPPLPPEGGEQGSSEGCVVITARRQFPLALFRFTGVSPCA